MKRKMYPLLTALLFVGTVAPLVAEAKLFPVSRQIEANVDFWTKIYAVYPTSSVVIHDKEDLSVVYGVVKLDDGFQPTPEYRLRWAVVEQEKERFAAALKRLAKMPKPIELDSLDAVQLHVYIEWSHVQDDLKYARAIDNMRAQVGLSDRFRESVRRSGLYWDHIEEILQQEDLPLELAYLPHVESLFNYESYSKAGAAGIWQFITHTGRLFMNIDDAVDERVDPIAATAAAAKLLKKSYEELGSWPLAITAYNHGLSGMKAARQQFGNDDFGIIYEQYKGRSFGFASRNFYAEFIAAMHVAKNYKTYFGPIIIAAPLKFQSVKLFQPLLVKEAAEIFDVSVDTLIHYNRAFRTASIKNMVKLPTGYLLMLPYREGYDPREALAQRTAPTKTPSTGATQPLPTASKQASPADALGGANGGAEVINLDFLQPSDVAASSEGDRSQ